MGPKMGSQMGLNGPQVNPHGFLNFGFWGSFLGPLLGPFGTLSGSFWDPLGPAPGTGPGDRPRGPAQGPAPGTGPVGPIGPFWAHWAQIKLILFCVTVAHPVQVGSIWALFPRDPIIPGKRFVAQVTLSVSFFAEESPMGQELGPSNIREILSRHQAIWEIND